MGDTRALDFVDAGTIAIVANRAYGDLRREPWKRASRAGWHIAGMRTLTRRELTTALAARQMLLDRQRLDPVEAIRRLTPLQGQEPRAPYIALAARLAGFTRDQLEVAIQVRKAVKSTLMRTTLHIAAADENRRITSSPGRRGCAGCTRPTRSSTSRRSPPS
jgi:hypothetical protein